MDEILDGDAVVILATLTAAGGVVLSLLSNFGLRDRQAGVLRSVNASVAKRKKLDRISANPSVAVAYHTRAHGFGNRPEYVLVQGTASLGRSVPDYPSTIRDVWERYAGQGTADVGFVMRWWQRVFRLRVEIQVAIERIIVWPDLECGGSPQIVGCLLRIASRRRSGLRKMASHGASTIGGLQQNCGACLIDCSAGSGPTGSR